MTTTLKDVTRGATFYIKKDDRWVWLRATKCFVLRRGPYAPLHMCYARTRDEKMVRLAEHPNAGRHAFEIHFA